MYETITPAPAFLATHADDTARGFFFGVARDTNGQPLNPLGSYGVYAGDEFVAWVSVGDDDVVTVTDENEKVLGEVTAAYMLVAVLKAA